MPYYQDEAVTLHLGDSLDILRTLPDASVDAVVTDPPYEIGIAGQAWDRTGIAYSVELWGECLRVLKPGGHLIAFGHVRTYHRMVCAAEDADFRIVDQLDWIYTHAKPKGADLARTIDRRRDDREQVLRVTAWLAAARDAAGWTTRQMNALFGFHPNGKAGHWVTQGVAAAIPTPEQWAALRSAMGFDDAEILPVVSELQARKGTAGEAWERREVVSRTTGKPRTGGLYPGYSGQVVVSTPQSEAAKTWHGWKTKLKPAHDPILLARKPTGFHTLTANILRHGVGGLNVAGCPASGGGWPANILLGHDCPEGWCEPGCPVREVGDAARTFPVFRLNSRTPDAERLEVDGARHETQKPLALMRWLVRLVTPPGGTVLEPFAGSGTTLEAAALEGFHAVGIERHEPYAALCRARLDKPMPQTLFGEIA